MHHAFEPPVSPRFDSLPPSPLDGNVVALGLLEERVQELMFCIIDADDADTGMNGRISPLGLVGRLTPNL